MCMSKVEDNIPLGVMGNATKTTWGDESGKGSMHVMDRHVPYS